MPRHPRPSTSRAPAEGSANPEGSTPFNAPGQPEVTTKKKTLSAASQIQIKVICQGLTALQEDHQKGEEIIDLLNATINDLDKELEQIVKMRSFATKARLFQHGLLRQETPPETQPTLCVLKDEDDNEIGAGFFEEPNEPIAGPSTSSSSAYAKSPSSPYWFTELPEDSD